MRSSLVTVVALLLAFSFPGTQPRAVPPAAAHDHHAAREPGGAPAAAPKGAPWGATYFPNVPLVTHEGKPVRFYEDLLQDKKVLINFIYTQCDQACPLDTAKLAQVQKRLGPRVGRDFFLYSITLDPEHDTPAALQAYAAKFGAGPGWLFLTGKREDIDRVRFKLGERGQKEEHANTVRVGDVARGQWMRLPLTADPNYLVVEITKTLDPSRDAGKPVKSIAEAPRREISEQEWVRLPGQTLFQNRCAACHTLGKGDHLGPDLQGVTARRERAWLIRYLAAPDRVRASKDPIAVELAKRYTVPMPNLALTKKEVAELINYLEGQAAAMEKKETQSAAIAHPEGPQTAAVPAAPGGEKPPASTHHHHAGEEM